MTTTTEMAFSLAALIDQVRDEVGPEPADIAAKVEPLIPEAHRHAVFLMLLTRHVANSKPRLSQAIRQRPAPDLEPPARAGRIRSAKVAAHQQHNAWLRRVPVPVEDGATKFLGDCTFADLMWAAKNRRAHAAHTIASAEKFEALAALVKRHKVRVVSELPAAVLATFESTWKAAA